MLMKLKREELLSYHINNSDYSQTCLFRTPWDPMKLFLLQRCPHFTGSFILHWDHNYLS